MFTCAEEGDSVLRMRGCTEGEGGCSHEEKERGVHSKGRRMRTRGEGRRERLSKRDGGAVFRRGAHSRGKGVFT